MALLANGFRDTSGVFQTFGATASNNAYPSALWANYARTGANRNISAGQGITDDKAGRPIGYLHPGAWMLPQKVGAMSSHNRTRGSATATLTLVSGRNIAGSSAGVATGTATLQLVVSMQASSAGVATVTGNVFAALGMVGSSAGSSTATAQKNALGWLYGSSAGSCTATLTRYATGRLYGSITPFTELSPESLAASVWAAAAATNNAPDTMGEKLNSAGGAADPWDDSRALTVSKFLGLK